MTEQLNKLLARPVGGFSGQDLLSLLEFQKSQIVAELKKDQSPEVLPRWMTRQQVKDYLQFRSMASVDNVARRGLLTKHYVAGSPRFDRMEVENYLNSQKK